MRRAFFLASFAIAGAIIVSCSDEKKPVADTPDAGGDAADTRPPTPPEWDRQVTRPDEAAAAADRASCKFARGALPDETLGASIPVSKDIPIETIVVLMQENRSFDHYFGRFGKYAGRTDVESAADDATNPETIGGGGGDAGASDGGAEGGAPVHARKRGDVRCFSDTNHEWSGSHTQYDDGKNDGFYQSNNDGPGERSGDRALWWYDEQELPYYYALAKEFSLGDHYHCALLGPTWPNRMYLVAGTSFGRTENTFPDLANFAYPTNDAMIFDELDKRHVDFRMYTPGGPPGAAITVGIGLSNRWGTNPVDTMEAFFAAAAAGTLPPVSFVDANFLTEGSAESQDEHPPGDIQIGQKFTHDMVDALFKSPQWKNMAIFLTYDEHGGLYDHVPPPKACAPDDKPPLDNGGKPLEGAFDRLGFRVPFIVVSPYAKRNYVSHDVLDHTSILRFIQAKFRVPALTSRDANALVPIDFFDFASPPRLDPPSLPSADIDQAGLAACRALFPKK